ncbi:DUF6371 domain-containing protein [Spirosoma telluris]|uniref:DUF6371 domain-containing protein n=1 Tax=Spirosoma telluris TaxID=2183553 RepID=UPI002FC33C3C
MVKDGQQRSRTTLFGLPQLQTADADQPIALVEAPKTAIISMSYFSGFIWMAVVLGQGLQITVSAYLEDNAPEDERAAGADLADFLLEQWHEYSTQWEV